MRGGPLAVDETGAAYRNELATDRALTWANRGGREGVLSGGAVTPSATELAVSVAPFEALVQAEVGGVAVAQGWYAWNDVAETVPVGAPSASPRIDALVCAVRDPGLGAIPAGTVAGPQWVVVPGTPGAAPVAPSNATIAAAVGPGGWLLVRNVRVDPGNTVVAAASITTVAGSSAVAAPYARLNKVTDNTLVSTSNTSLVGYHAVAESSPTSFADLPNNRLVVPRNGLYLLTLQVTFGRSGTGLRRVCLAVNDATVLGQEVSGQDPGLDGQSIILSSPWRLVAGDLVTGLHAQNSGVSLTLPGSITQPSYTFLSAAWLRD